MTTTAAAPTPQPMSPAARLVNVFLEPRAAMTDLKHHATAWSWILPWVVMAVFSLAFVYVVEKQVGFEQVSQNQLRLSPRAAEQMERLPADQRARQVEMMAKGFRYFAYAFPLVWLVLLLIVSAVLLGTFNFGLGSNVPFRTALAIVFYATVPSAAVRSILAIVSLYAGVDPESFTFQNPVATNLGYFFSPSEVGFFLFGVLTNLDLMMFWTLALTGLGFAIAGKIKTGTAIGVVFGWWILFTLVTSGLGALTN